MLDHQRDILAPQALLALRAALERMQKVIAEKPDKAVVEKEIAALEKVANQSLKPYPHAAWRENIEVFLARRCLRPTRRGIEWLT